MAVAAYAIGVIDRLTSLSWSLAWVTSSTDHLMSAAVSAKSPNLACRISVASEDRISAESPVQVRVAVH